MPNSIEDFSGLSLDDRYRLIRPLARGGMGTVYLGFQESLGREVAIKVLAPSPLKSSATNRFIREARDICRLFHPHIITYYDYGCTSHGLHYLVMELLQGVSAHHLIYGGAELSLSTLAHVLEQLCSALAEAHRQGVTHRDLKWGNVMICRVGDDHAFTKLIDFGIAKLPLQTPCGLGRTQTSVGSILGTPAYMSPEQAQGKPVDGRSDQYALGVMLWEAFEGKRPFDRKNSIATAQAHISEPIPPFVRSARLMRRVPKLAQVIHRALAKSPEGRFPCMNILRQALLAALKEAILVRQETLLLPKIPALGQTHHLPSIPLTPKLDVAPLAQVPGSEFKMSPWYQRLFQIRSSRSA